MQIYSVFLQTKRVNELMCNAFPCDLQVCQCDVTRTMVVRVMPRTN